MFKAIFDAFSIYLEGTMFRRRHKHAWRQKYASTLWGHPLEMDSATPPYVLIQEEYKIKNDVITKFHYADNWLQEARIEDKRGRAKWLPSLYQQVYDPPLGPAPNMQVELYYRVLGLNMARDMESTWQGLAPMVH